ncbi:MAG: hypothetical protein KJ574_05390 [Nanoarchaeota archaeon]|nr:hypothetical protein [Nanoarchaeota archaeon]
MKKEEFIPIKSEITEDGISISVKNKKYVMRYPKEIWKKYHDTNKEFLLDNLTFIQTCHIPASNNKDGNVYSTALPLFETFAFKSTMYDLPASAQLDNQKTTDYFRKFFNSSFLFASYNTVMPKSNTKRRTAQNKRPVAVVLFTAGKESLLTLGLCLEMGVKPIPIYIDENPQGAESRHKEKIIDALRKEYGIEVYHLLNEPGDLREEDLQGNYNSLGSGPQLLAYTLAVMPFVEYFDAEYILFGNEYSCDSYTKDAEGFNSNFCFDQSSEWTKQLSVVSEMMTGGKTEVGSIVSPLYELGVVKILHERYPHLANLQMSCFCWTPEGQHRKWCGNCSKCARLFVFFKALGIDTASMGFVNDMFSPEKKGLFSPFEGDNLNGYDSSGLGNEEQALAFFLAIEKGEKGPLLDEFKNLPIYSEIKNNFRMIHKKYFSQYESLAVPLEFKESIMDIFDESFEGKFTPKNFRIRPSSTPDQLNNVNIREKVQANIRDIP